VPVIAGDQLRPEVSEDWERPLFTRVGGNGRRWSQTRWRMVRCRISAARHGFRTFGVRVLLTADTIASVDTVMP
jgi:hypothetical protein